MKAILSSYDLVIMLTFIFDHNEAIILLIESFIIFLSIFYHNHNDLQVPMAPSLQQLPLSQVVSFRIGWQVVQRVSEVQEILPSQVVFCRIDLWVHFRKYFFQLILLVFFRIFQCFQIIFISSFRLFFPVSSLGFLRFFDCVFFFLNWFSSIPINWLFLI